MRLADFVPQMIRVWARQKRRAMTGIRRWADGGEHEDGFPSISFAAFAKEGGITGGAGVSEQHFAEVYHGDGLRIWRIYNDSPGEVREILFTHYIVTGHASRKARDMGISLAFYWKRLANAHYYVGGYLAGASAQREQERKRLGEVQKRVETELFEGV